MVKDDDDVAQLEKQLEWHMEMQTETMNGRDNLKAGGAQRSNTRGALGRDNDGDAWPGLDKWTNLSQLS